MWYGYAMTLSLLSLLMAARNCTRNRFLFAVWRVVFRPYMTLRGWLGELVTLDSSRLSTSSAVNRSNGNLNSGVGSGGRRSSNRLYLLLACAYSNKTSCLSWLVNPTVPVSSWRLFVPHMTPYDWLDGKVKSQPRTFVSFNSRLSWKSFHPQAFWSVAGE